MAEAPYDARAIANLMLDEADRMGIRLTHLPLQKLLYFAHGLFLVERKRPLVSGYFEAWQRGPVHPTVYQAFKSAGSKPIEFRAVRHDVATNELIPLPAPEAPQIRAHIGRIILQYGHLPAGLLVTISHAKGGPWDHAVDKRGTKLVYGARIGENAIQTLFKHHKVSIGAPLTSGDPGEDTPPS